MKVVKELKIEELSVRQKIGMTMIGWVMWGKDTGEYKFSEDFEYLLEMIRNRCLGAVWISPIMSNREDAVRRIYEAADYPILIMTDAESGLGEYKIGRHRSIGVTGSEELAYTFGKVTAVQARKIGYNTVCDPVVDMKASGSRSMGTDKEKVASLAVAIAKGMHDGGVLSVAKHYPGGSNPAGIDVHMTRVGSPDTKEELLGYSLYPYIRLMKEQLLDGIMVEHKKYPKIDPDRPASLSEKVIGIIREQGFDGFFLTDALEGMQAITASYGKDKPKGMAIAAGNDLALVYGRNKPSFEAMCACYEEGMISDERLDEAVRRVLEAQHKVTLLPKVEQITEEEKENFRRISRDGIYAKVDDGLPVSVSREGRHLFAIMVHNGLEISDQGKVVVDTFNESWYRPDKLTDRLEAMFPNSAVCAIDQFPSAAQNCRILNMANDYDDVVFVTFVDNMAYVGPDCLTSRILAVMQALLISGKLTTVVNFGNPAILEPLPHIPRILVGMLAADSVDAAVDVLAGAYPAKGVLTAEVDFQ